MNDRLSAIAHVDRFLDPAGQHFQRERLGEDVHAGVEVAVAQRGVAAWAKAAIGTSWVRS